jgi:tRNA (cmo5U34)-methyltransferase
VGAASHLGIRLRDYDRLIRSFIPHYTRMLDQAAEAVASLEAPAPVVVELGVGSGALARRCATRLPRARLVGIDADERILEMARARVPRLTTICGDFQKVRLPPCDAVTASFSLHHVPTRRAKARLYERIHAALRSGGVFVNADCCLASSAVQQERDREAWLAHLQQTFSRRKSLAYLETWGREDVYQRLEDEVALLGAAGFVVDVIWRHGSFAVVAARRA